MLPYLLFRYCNDNEIPLEKKYMEKNYMKHHAWLVTKKKTRMSWIYYTGKFFEKFKTTSSRGLGLSATERCTEQISVTDLIMEVSDAT